MLSEVDRRIAETKKDMYEFKRDIIGMPQTSIALSWLLSDRSQVAAESFLAACKASPDHLLSHSQHN